MTPPHVVQGAYPVVANEVLARSTHRLRFRAAPLAARLRAGQFVMIRIPGRTDPLLGRAFALYRVAGEDVEIVHLVVGKMTRLLAGLRPGDAIEAWGPLGNGFPSYAGEDHLVLVAGGIGQTPFLALVEDFIAGSASSGARVSLYYGVRSAEYLAGVAEFEQAGAQVRLASDDGSVGYQGFVTQLLERDLDAGLLGARPRLVGCGPEPMLHALAMLAERRGLRCDVSLETPMACGVGICFSCVTRVKTAQEWDYRRTCVDGPVFDAATLAWNA